MHLTSNNDAVSTPRRFVLARPRPLHAPHSDTIACIRTSPPGSSTSVHAGFGPTPSAGYATTRIASCCPAPALPVGKDAVRYFWPDGADDQRAQASERKHDVDLSAARGALLRLRREVAALSAELKFRRFFRYIEGLQPQPTSRARREFQTGASGRGKAVQRGLKRIRLAGPPPDQRPAGNTLAQAADGSRAKRISEVGGPLVGMGSCRRRADFSLCDGLGGDVVARYRSALHRDHTKTRRRRLKSCNKGLRKEDKADTIFAILSQQTSAEEDGGFSKKSDSMLRKTWCASQH